MTPIAAGGDDLPDEYGTNADKSSTLGETVLGLLMVLGVLYGAYVLVGAIDPGMLKLGKDPGVLELVIGDRTVLTVVRLTVIFAAIYAAYSFAALIRLGRPVSKFGPAQADAAADTAQIAAAEGVEVIDLLSAEVNRLEEDNLLLVEEVQDLRSRLKASKDADDPPV